MRRATRHALALGAAVVGALALPAGAPAAGPHFSPFLLPRVIHGPCGGFCDIAEVAISNTGEVVGSTSANGGTDEIWTWRPGQGIRIVGDGPFGLGAVPSAVADDGDIVGAMGTPNGQRAFLLHGGTFHDLGVLPGGEESGASAINDRGQVAVNVLMTTGFTQAAVWTPRSGLRGLGTHGGLASHATGIDDAEEVVGFFSPTHGRDRAFLWRDGRMISLGALRGPASGHESRAFAINDAGLVVGGSLLAHEGHAVSWSPERRISDLGLGEAVDVNDAGDILLVDRLLAGGKLYDLTHRTVQFGGANGSSLNDHRQMVSGECFVARCRPSVLEPVSPFDDRRPEIRYSGSWTRSVVPGAWRGGTTHASAAGATATFHFRGRRVWWVAPRSPDGGSARVFVDGSPAATVTLRSDETIPRQTAFQRGFATLGPHTLRIVVAGTGRVDVDAFTVSRF